MQNKDFQLLHKSCVRDRAGYLSRCNRMASPCGGQAMLNAGLSAQDAAVGAEAAMGKLRQMAQPASTCRRKRLRHAGKTGRKMAAGRHHQWQCAAGLFGLGITSNLCCGRVPHGRSKPFNDMYHLAAEKLNLPLGEMLHG